MKNTYVKRELVYENELSEIDFKLQEEFGLAKICSYIHGVNEARSQVS